MASTTGSAPCIFCDITAGRAEASVVYEDATTTAFMDLNPVTAGHLLVVPRDHAVGLEDLEEATGTHVFAVAHRLAKAVRRSELQPDGINLLLCDGVAAFQTVFHLHLHLIPRYEGDGWIALNHHAASAPRALLETHASVIREGLALVG